MAIDDGVVAVVVSPRREVDRERIAIFIVGGVGRSNVAVAGTVLNKVIGDDIDVLVPGVKSTVSASPSSSWVV
ncbi:hypothetical protein JMA39_17670 [Shewanella schlegeliana]|uniref:Uncharacterized protein n=1 Tax=Shewanella schlegeliana TaxID=190308 RepID=A0ABS1T2B1_9GAMM|nr:hypothetical protein [Shewanella schlegeliana]